MRSMRRILDQNFQSAWQLSVSSVPSCSTPKPRFPRADAIAVARELVGFLTPAVNRLVIAGSLRRRRPAVGDVEVLYIPKFFTERDGLFDTRNVNMADLELETLLKACILRKRTTASGAEPWGPKNKFAVHTRTGIPVDLFQAAEANWWNYLVCRTGSADTNIRIASAAKAKGWTWKPYGAGFLDDHGAWRLVRSEQDVFTLAGLPYLEPWQR